MVQLDIFNCNGGVCIQKFEVSDFVFNKRFNKSLVFQVLLLSLSLEKIRSKAQKTRGEVRGGGRKPWKQKGTGRARAGTIRSPLWRGGGVVFASAGSVTNSRKKVNKRMYKLALMCVLSEFVRKNCIFVVDDFFLVKPSVSCFLERIKFCFFSSKRKYLLIISNSIKDEEANVIFRSAHNIQYLTVKRVNCFSIVDLVRHEVVIFFKNSIDELYKIVSL